MNKTVLSPFGTRKFLSGTVGFLALLGLFGGRADSAPLGTEWLYKFGTSTGTFTTSGTSNSFVPTPGLDGGNAYVRVGTTGGGFALQNPGESILGDGSELVMTAPTSASINKFAINGYSLPSTAYTLAFSSILSGNSGYFSVFTGTGSSFSTTTSAFTSAQSATGLRFQLGASTVSGSFRSGGNWSTSGLNTTSLAQNTVLNFRILGNNSSTPINYSYGGAQSVGAYSFDLWLNDTLIGDNLAKGQLGNDVGIDSFMFYSESSVGNAGTMRLDDISYANAIVVPEPGTISLVGVAVGGIGILAMRRRHAA